MAASASWSGSSRHRCLAATAIGAAIGAVGGKALHKKIGSNLEESAGETIPIGGAGLDRRVSALGGGEGRARRDARIQKVVGEADGHHVQALKGAIADAQKKMAEEGQNS